MKYCVLIVNLSIWCNSSKTGMESTQILRILQIANILHNIVVYNFMSSLLLEKCVKTRAIFLLVFI
jgi:hypothetical protein